MSEHKRRPWTAAEHAHMVALLREGKTIQQIADTLGRAHGSVASRSSATDSQGQYHGSMAFQPWTDEIKSVAHRMYDAAESFEAIAAAIGRTVPAVQRHFNMICAQAKAPTTGPKAKALRECIPCRAFGRKTVFMSDHAGVRICQRCRDRIARSDVLLTPMAGEML